MAYVKLRPDHFVKPPSYIIFKREKVCKALNCMTQEVEFSGIDASTVIQSAIDALKPPVHGGTILFKKGDYILTKRLDLTGAWGITLLGENYPPRPDLGRGVRFILADGANDHIIYKSEATLDWWNTLALIRNIALYGNKANNPTAPSLMHFRNCGNIKIENCKLGDGKSHGIQMEICRFIWIRDCEIGMTGTPNDGDGIHMDGCSPVFIGGCHQVENDNGIYLTDKSYFAENLNLHDNIIVRNRGSAVKLEKADNDNLLTSMSIIGNALDENEKHGIEFIIPTARTDYVKNVQIIGNRFITNSFVLNNTYDGINLTGNAREWTVIGNYFVNLIAGKMRYGIYISGDMFYSTIIANQFAALATAPLSIGTIGTEVYIKRNRGYITENSGTGTIPTGATTATISHGLVGTPKFVLPSPHHAEIADIRVIAKTATNFTVEVSTAPTADRTFDWYAEV